MSSKPEPSATHGPRPTGDGAGRSPSSWRWGRTGRARRSLQRVGLLVLPAVLRCRQSAFVLGTEPALSGLFDLRGVDFAAWTLAAFAIGVLAGTLIRRIVPAIVATLAVYAGLAIIATNVLRSTTWHRWSRKTSNIPGTALILSEWWTRGESSRLAEILQSSARLCPPRPSKAGPDDVSPSDLNDSASSSMGTRSGPTTRRRASSGRSSWIEGGWLLGLSVLLFGVTVWLVRRRAA